MVKHSIKIGPYAYGSIDYFELIGMFIESCIGKKIYISSELMLQNSVYFGDPVMLNTTYLYFRFHHWAFHTIYR